VYRVRQTRVRGKSVTELMDLGNGINYWWMSTLEEKCIAFKSPHIVDVIKIIALRKVMKEKIPGHMVFVSDNRKVGRCLKRWCEEKGVTFEWRRTEAGGGLRDCKKRIFEELPSGLKAPLWLFRKWLSTNGLNQIEKRSWLNFHGDITIVSYFVGKRGGTPGEAGYTDMYWGSLPKTLKSRNVKIKWLYIYAREAFRGSNREAAEAISSLNRASDGKSSHMILDSFMSFDIAIKSILLWSRLMIRVFGNKRPVVPRIWDVDVWEIMSRDWWDSLCGISVMHGIVVSLLFQQLNSDKHGKACIYLMESQGWESALVQWWKMSRKGPIVGCAHTTVRFWDLRNFSCKKDYLPEGRERPLPDRVLVNGALGERVMIEGGIPVKMIHRVESLRYMYLNMRQARIRRERLDGESFRLLAICDYSLKGTTDQLSLLKSEWLKRYDIQVIIKSHPATKIPLNILGGVGGVISSQSLEELLPKVDCVYTGNSTSAAIEAYILGIPVVTFCDPSTLNLSPLRGAVGHIKMVRSSEEFRDAMLHMLNAPSVITSKKGLADFFLDDSLSSWIGLIKELLE